MMTGIMKFVLISIVMSVDGSMQAMEPNQIIQLLAKSAQKAVLLYRGEKVEASNYLIWYEDPKDSSMFVVMNDRSIVRIAPRVMSLGAWINNPKLGVKNEFDIPTEIYTINASKRGDVGEAIDTALKQQAPDKLPWMIETGEIAKITIINSKTSNSQVIPLGLPGKWNQSPWKIIARWLNEVLNAQQKRIGPWGKIPEVSLPNCLVWAIVNHRNDDVRRLLSSGADIDKSEKLVGDNLEEMARERGNFELAEILSSWKRGS